MKYICLVYQDASRLDDITDEELASVVESCGSWVGELEAGGHHIYSAGLQAVRTATCLRTVGGKVTMTDGPFAETKEYLGGFTLLEARDLNEALHLASRLPAVKLGTVEVRPLLEEGATLTDPVDIRVSEMIARGHKSLTS
jgi:hypothetical protein